MTLENLKQFRTGVYTILGNAKDALFDLMDAVLVTRSVYSFAELINISRVSTAVVECIRGNTRRKSTTNRTDEVVYKTTDSNRTSCLGWRPYSLVKITCQDIERANL
jgi:hypothetical protein